MSSQRPSAGSRVLSHAAARFAAVSLLLAAALMTAAPAARSQLNFNFTYASNTDARAVAGFQQAANLWSARINDPITVNLTIGFRDLGGGTLAQASSALYFTSYTSFRTFLQADITSATDVAAVSSLPLSPTIPLYLNRTAENPNGVGSETPYVDNDGDSNNSFVLLTGANAKALGFTISGTQDGIIEFNSGFAFDFDRGDGIDAGAFDFVGIAAHEIGHTLGFLSTADDVDFSPGRADSAYLPTSLDMFRFSSASTSTAVTGFGVGVRDISADQRDKYFSLDGGRTSLAMFSTGVSFGDGRQASHWKDDQGLGIMDPTVGSGELLLITGNDLMAFDAIGWNLVVAEVPEPSTLPLIGGAVLALGGVRVFRRRRRAG